MDTNFFLISSVADEAAVNWTAVGSIATALAAGIALVVYLTQLRYTRKQAKESTSKFYLEHCMKALGSVMELLHSRASNPEVLCEVASILAGVTQLEREITFDVDRQVYNLHRSKIRYEIESIVKDLPVTTWSGNVFKMDAEANEKWIRSLLNFNDREQLPEDASYLAESLFLSGEVFHTPFSGVPLGLCLSVLRFITNGAHFSRPTDQLTKYEYSQLLNDPNLENLLEYVNFCLELDIKIDEPEDLGEKANGWLLRRNEDIDLYSLNLNLDSRYERHFIQGRYSVPSPFDMNG